VDDALTLAGAAGFAFLAVLHATSTAQTKVTELVRNKGRR
jgi:hypothetical protein